MPFCTVPGQSGTNPLPGPIALAINPSPHRYPRTMKNIDDLIEGAAELADRGLSKGGSRTN